MAMKISIITIGIYPRMYLGKVGRVLLFFSWYCLAAWSSPAAAGAACTALQPGWAPARELPWSWWVLWYGHKAKVSQQGAKRLLQLKNKM